MELYFADDLSRTSSISARDSCRCTCHMLINAVNLIIRVSSPCFAVKTEAFQLQYYTFGIFERAWAFVNFGMNSSLWYQPERQRQRGCGFRFVVLVSLCVGLPRTS